MKIDTRQLKAPLAVTIGGNEDWLDRLYEAFPVDSGTPIPRVQGQVTVLLDSSGDVLLSGELQYTPFVGCGRCDMPILWPLHVELDGRYRRASFDSRESERELTPSEMDISFLDDYNLDLGQAVLEQILLALPSSTTKVCLDTGSCEVCGESVADEEVYRDTTSDEQNPFAALRDLTFDDDDDN